MSEPNEDSRAWRELRRSLDIAFVEQRRARRWGIFFKLVTLAYVTFILVSVIRANNVDPFESGATGHLAVVSVTGVIAADGQSNADQILAGVQAALEHPGTRGLMLDINSGGGSPVQADRVWRGIKRIRDEHPTIPFVASISDIGASGAYYIASAMDDIYADESSLVGSIGVISSGFGFTEAAKKLGIERRLITAGGDKALLDPFSELDADQVEHWRSVLAGTHEVFIERVKSGRGARLDGEADLFSGLIWNGRQALQLGLIDGHLSPMEFALSELNTDQIIDFTLQPSPLEAISRNLGVEVFHQLKQWTLPLLN